MSGEPAQHRDAKSTDYRGAKSTDYRGAKSTDYGNTRSGSTPYRGGVVLSSDEERELYVILKPRESSLQGQLDGLLRRIEKSLFSSLTIEEIEKLAERFPRDR